MIRFCTAAFIFNLFACAFLLSDDIPQEKGLPPTMMFRRAQDCEREHCNGEAIRWYQACIEAGSGQEEVWGSLYKLGELYEAMGFWDQALISYQRAFEKAPHRAEPLYKIARHYRFEGQNHLAYLYLKQALQLPVPKKDQLLFSQDLYDYQLDEELSIAAFYTPFKEEGRATTDRLLLKQNIPYGVKLQAGRNMVHYAPILNQVKIQEIKIALPLIREGGTETYSPMNPSIRRTPQGYHIICRTVNYLRFGETGFTTKDPLDSVLKTRNFLLDYDQNFNLLSQKEIIENFPRHWTASSQGLEDCRLFEFQGADWFSCTTIGTHPRTIGQTLCKLASTSANNDIQVERFTPLKGPDDARVKKTGYHSLKRINCSCSIARVHWSFIKSTAKMERMTS